MPGFRSFVGTAARFALLLTQPLLLFAGSGLPAETGAAVYAVCGLAVVAVFSGVGGRIVGILAAAAAASAAALQA